MVYISLGKLRGIRFPKGHTTAVRNYTLGGDVPLTRQALQNPPFCHPVDWPLSENRPRSRIFDINCTLGSCSGVVGGDLRENKMVSNTDDANGDYWGFC